MTPRSERGSIGGEDKSGHIPCIQLDYRDHRDRLRPYGRVERLVVVGSAHIGQGSSADHHSNGPPTELPRARLPGCPARGGREEGDLARRTDRLRRDSLDIES